MKRFVPDKPLPSGMRILPLETLDAPRCAQCSLPYRYETQDGDLVEACGCGRRFVRLQHRLQFVRYAAGERQAMELKARAKSQLQRDPLRKGHNKPRLPILLARRHSQ